MLPDDIILNTRRAIAGHRLRVDAATSTSDPVANPGSGAGIFQATGFYDDPSNTYDPGGRLGQIMFRFNW